MVTKSIKKQLKSIKLYTDILIQDISNKLKYGPNAPKHFERIWINPQDVNYFISKEEIKRVTGKSRQEASGTVIDWDEVKNITPLEEDFRYRYAFERWRDGKTWDEIGVYEYMKNETIKYKDMSQAELEERYRRFDELFQNIKNDGRMKCRKEIDASVFREENGILIHIGDGGKLYFGGIGFHRFSIAKVLELKTIPACIGIVAKSSIDYLNKLRIEP